MTIISNDKNFIIAEIGMNHNGDFNIAEKSIVEAKRAGANAVKFQTFNTENFLSENYFSKEDFLERKKHELSLHELDKLIKISKDLDIIFFSTPFDEKSVDILDNLNIELYKVASADINNWPLIRKIIKKNKPILFSTGYSNIDEIKEAHKEYVKHNVKQLGIMHCVASYPTEINNINLQNINLFKSMFNNTVVGISDHTIDTDIVPSAAFFMGAKIIEKHFTLDNTLSGYDHKISLNPKQFNKMVENLNRTKLIKGLSRYETGTLDCEKEKKEIARRSVFLKQSKSINESLTKDDLIPLRPGTGISVNFWDKLIGRKISRNLNKGHMLSWDDLLK